MKAVTKVETPEPRLQPFSIRPLLEALHDQTAADWDGVQDIRDSFESVIEPLLPAYEDAERAFLRAKGRLDETVRIHVLPMRTMTEVIVVHDPSTPLPRRGSSCARVCRVGHPSIRPDASIGCQKQVAAGSFAHLPSLQNSGLTIQNISMPSVNLFWTGFRPTNATKP